MALHAFRKLVLTAALTPFLLGAALPRPFDERVLDAQNLERAELGIPQLEWDADLAADAKAWAVHLARTNRFEHSVDAPGTEPQGENLWAGTRGYYSPEAMVDLWASEKKNYRFGIFPDNSTTGDIEDVGHYTQLIWYDTRRVGCAVAQSNEEDILVCRYSQAGNVIGQIPT